MKCAPTKSIRLVLLVAALGAGGCAHNKETVPLARSWAPVRAANQQRVLALAVDDAVEQLDLAQVAGKSVMVDLSGVFPHSDGDLMDYVIAQVEGRAARAGARVLPRPPKPVPFVLGTIAPAPPAKVEPPVAVPDFKLLVGVSWAGIDTREKVVTDENRLSGQVGLAVGGILAGYAVQNAGNSSLRYVLPGGKSTTSTRIMIGGVVGAGVWAAIKPPFIKTTTLIGRARVVVNANPVAQGVAFETEGAGTSRIVVDEGSQEGYKLTTKTGTK